MVATLGQHKSRVLQIVIGKRPKSGQKLAGKGERKEEIVEKENGQKEKENRLRPHLRVESGITIQTSASEAQPSKPKPPPFRPVSNETNPHGWPNNLAVESIIARGPVQQQARPTKPTSGHNPPPFSLIYAVRFISRALTRPRLPQLPM